MRCRSAPQSRQKRHGGIELKHLTHKLQVSTRGKGLYEITRQVQEWLSNNSVSTGLLTAFVQHTSASLVIQENADPDVVLDLNEFFSRLVPEDNRRYRHTVEGPDDMPAHIRAALTQTNISIPVHEGKLALGTWQGIYVFEHRSVPHRRSVMLHLSGEP
jgi:secondary thiamine-phosphate synthase enzyme